MTLHPAPVRQQFILIWTRDGTPFGYDFVFADSRRGAEHEVFNLRILRGLDPFDCSVDCRVARADTIPTLDDVFSRRLRLA